MKNKLKKTMTALCAALILVGGFFCPCLCTGHSHRAARRGRDQRQQRNCRGKRGNAAPYPKGNATLVDDYGGNKPAYHCYHQKRQLFLYPH